MRDGARGEARPQRADREHYGLGLCIAREIVELHGGQIRVEDAPGGGAAFVAELPGGLFWRADREQIEKSWPNLYAKG